MGYLHDATDRGIVPEKVWAGTIATTATAMDDLLSVVIDGLDGHLRWTDCHWQPKDNITLPQRGDKCVVIMDDNGELWIVSWGDMPDVVDGKWVKGVGGAAVWTDIVDADVSKAAPRLSPGNNLQFDDCNLMIYNGWYRCSGATNGPPVNHASILVSAIDGNNLRQIAYDYDTDSVWMRRRQDGNWAPFWTRLTIDGSTYFGNTRQIGTQVGEANVSVGAGGTQQVLVPLNTPWPNRHCIFLCSVWPTQTWNSVYVNATGYPNDLAHGSCMIDNGVAQTFNVWYVSYGY